MKEGRGTHCSHILKCVRDPRNVREHTKLIIIIRLTYMCYIINEAYYYVLSFFYLYLTICRLQISMWRTWLPYSRPADILSASLKRIWKLYKLFLLPGIYSAHEDIAAWPSSQTIPDTQEQGVTKIHQMLPWLGRAQEAPRVNCWHIPLL